MKKIKKIIHIATHMGGGVGKAISGLICEADKENWIHSVILLEKPSEYRYVDCCKHAGIRIILAEEAEKTHMMHFLADADVIVLNWWGHPLMPKFIIEYLSDIIGRWVFWFHINGCSYPHIPYQLPSDSFASLFTTTYSLENPLWTKSECEIIKKKSDIIYGIGDFTPAAIRQKKQYHTNKLHIGYVGTVSYSKMNHHMLNYIRKLHEYIANMEITLVGECDEEIRKEILAKDMGGYVTCVGRVDDIYPYYESFDIFLYLLNPENYGTTENVLLEAMAVGLPIIVLNHPVECNIIKHGQNGYIAKDEQNLIELVAALNSDEEMRRTAGFQAREYVCKEYDVKVNREKYLNVLTQQCMKDKMKYPFEKNIGTYPYEWFQKFTGKKQEWFAQMLDKSIPDGNILSGETLAPIYVGKHKSSIYHFLEYYPQDQGLQQIASYIKCFKESNKEHTDGEYNYK